MITLLLALQLAGTPPATAISEMSQRQLDGISVKCGTPKRWLRRDGGSVHLRPSRSAKYEKVDCLLAELRRGYSGKIGFIGNEAYDPGEPK